MSFGCCGGRRTIRLISMFDKLQVCRHASTSEACPAAAERQKICSPRREPWVRVKIESQPRSGGTLESMMSEFRPSGAALLTLGLIPWLTPWATDLSPLRGLRFDRRCLIRASFSLSPCFDKLKLVGHQTASSLIELHNWVCIFCRFKGRCALL